MDTAKYKPKKDKIEEPSVSSVPDEIMKAVNDAFDIDYKTAKNALIEVGVDATGNLNEEQAKMFLKKFEASLDK